MPMKPKEMLKKYLAAGWVVIRQTGSHVQLRKGDKRQTIPMHNKDLKKGTEHALLKSLKGE